MSPLSFTGEYIHNKKKRLRLTLPDSWYEEFETFFFYPLREGALGVYPAPHFIQMLPRNQNFSGINNTVWDGNLSKTVEGERLFYTPPLHCSSEKCNSALKEAIKLGLDEIKLYEKNAPQKAGKEFERILYESLKSAGFNIQANIHLQGGEIDLLLIEHSLDNGLELSIIECKHHPSSQTPVSVSVVHRMFGLQEALRRKLPIKQSLIVSTTNFSKEATLFSQIYDLNSFNNDELADWFNYECKTWDSVMPLFKMAGINTCGGLSVPKEFSSYCLDGEEILLLGVEIGFEIWVRGLYENQLEMLNQYRSHSSEGPQGSAPLGKLQNIYDEMDRCIRNLEEQP